MKEIQFDPGQSIDRAIEKLKDAEATNGEPCYGMFNGVKITSSDDVDSAFSCGTRPVRDWLEGPRI